MQTFFFPHLDLLHSAFLRISLYWNQSISNNGYHYRMCVCSGWKRPQAHFSGHVRLYSHLCVRWGLQEWRKPSLLILSSTFFFLFKMFTTVQMLQVYFFPYRLSEHSKSSPREPVSQGTHSYPRKHLPASTGIKHHYKPSPKGLVNLLLYWSWPEFWHLHETNAQKMGNLWSSFQRCSLGCGSDSVASCPPLAPPEERGSEMKER